MSRWTMLVVLIAISGCGGAVSHQTLGDVGTNMVAATSPTLDRKVIFEATVKLIVTDLSQLEKELPKLVKEHEGFVAQVSIDRTHGHYLTGRWVARVPVKKYEAFLAAITKQGIADTFDQKSQDVTEEYVDLETRIANEKHLEVRILELLKQPAEEIKSVIEVERELARIRGEIEKMEGRVRFLADRTEFTTITIDAVERATYIAAPPPTLASRVAQSWRESISALRSVAEDLLIATVVLTPWISLALVIAVPAIWTLRRRRKRISPIPA